LEKLLSAPIKTIEETLKNLGPLLPFVGTWEGEKGDDVSLADDRGTEKNKFRERITLVPILPVDNHEQFLYGLRYSTVAHRIGDTDPFHEELGYWMWDPAEKQVMKSFTIPRGITVNAGGTVEPTAKSFVLRAEVGKGAYGICSNLFLDREFQTVSFEVKFTLHDAQSFSYEEDSVLKIKGQSPLFHHTDKNTLKRIA